MQISLKLARTGLAAGQSCQRQGCAKALSLHNLTCRDARRREQASTPLVKGAGSMPGQGRLPSAVPCGPWSERCEVGGGHAEHRRTSAALQGCGSGPPLWPCGSSDEAPKQSRHSPTCAECRDCLGAHAGAVVADGGGPTVRGRRRRKFLTQMSRK